MHVVFVVFHTSHCDGASRITDVLEDYDFGLKALAGEKYPARRLAPLRALECPALRGRWRFGNTNQWVMAWKAIVYAVHRRVLGRARGPEDVEPHAPMPLDAAIKDLEKVWGKHKKSPLGVFKLGRDVLPEAGEYTPNAYEQKFGLGEEGDAFYLTTSNEWCA